MPQLRCSCTGRGANTIPVSLMTTPLRFPPTGARISRYMRRIRAARRPSCATIQWARGPARRSTVTSCTRLGDLADSHCSRKKRSPSPVPRWRKGHPPRSPRSPPCPLRAPISTCLDSFTGRQFRSTSPVSAQADSSLPRAFCSALFRISNRALSPVLQLPHRLAPAGRAD